MMKSIKLNFFLFQSELVLLFFWSFHFIFVYLANFVHFVRSFYDCFPRSALNIIWIDEFCLLNEFFFYSQSPKDWALTLYRTNCDAKLDTLIENRNRSFSPLQKENICTGKAHVRMWLFSWLFRSRKVCVCVCMYVSLSKHGVHAILFKCLSACGCFAKILNRKKSPTPFWSKEKLSVKFCTCQMSRTKATNSLNPRKTNWNVLR